MVYFKLKDNTAENRKKLVAACEKYLADHDGVVFFSAGVIGDDFKRDVNDRRMMAIDHHLNSQNDELAREIEALRGEK